MKKEELFGLLDEMSLPDAIVDKLDASVWRFWQRKNHLDEEQTLRALQEYITLRTQKKDTRFRENAYRLYGQLLRRNPGSEHGQFFVDCLGGETDKQILHTILTYISSVRLPAEVRIGTIVTCSRSDQWLVRLEALQALQAFNTPESREAVRYWVRQEEEKKCKFELFYANAALGFIGEVSDIALLERHTHSRIRDVRDTAVKAINNICQRFGIPSKIE